MSEYLWIVFTIIFFILCWFYKKRSEQLKERLDSFMALHYYLCLREFNLEELEATDASLRKFNISINAFLNAEHARQNIVGLAKEHLIIHEAEKRVFSDES